MKKIIILSLFVLLFCGCKDYKELNNIAIVSGIAIDKEDNNYKVSALIANSEASKETGIEASAFNSVYEVNNSSISEAIQKLDSILPKQIYLGHLGVIVVSEEIAKEGLEEVTDYFFRNPETTKRFYLIMTEKDKKAGDVLKILSPLESFPFQNIRLNIENASTSGALSPNITYSKFLEMYLKKGSDPFLPTITINGDINNGSSTKSLESSDISSHIEVKGIALFKDDKFKAYASEDESRGLNIAMGNANDAVIKTSNNVILKISDIKSKKKLYRKNETMYLNINVKGVGDIQEVNNNINLYDEKTINNIKKNTESEMQKIIIKGVNKIKNKKCDVLEIGNMIYKKYPNLYKKKMDYLNDIKISINVSIDIQNKGSIKQSIKAAKK